MVFTAVISLVFAVVLLVSATVVQAFEILGFAVVLLVLAVVLPVFTMVLLVQFPVV